MTSRVLRGITPPFAEVDLVAVALKRGSAAYYLARVQREHPTSAQRVVTGGLSVYKASLEAGLDSAGGDTKWTKADAYMQHAAV